MFGSIMIFLDDLSPCSVRDAVQTIVNVMPGTYHRPAGYPRGFTPAYAAVPAPPGTSVKPSRGRNPNQGV